ncbi:MAG: hypothetical protein L3J70_03715 [Gammaproteobacteria bacterium]|nr:hypothetical protein [Gammaproteobacteria bacterium]
MKKLLWCMFAIFLTLLSACGGDGVTEPNEPKITSFRADKNSIIAGTGVNLTPIFSDGTGSIDNGIGQVTSGISVLVTPDSTTKYTLTVKNSDGKSVMSTTTVRVSEPPNLLEKLAGKVRFDYTVNSFLFSTTANLSSIVFNGEKYLFDRVTSTACLLFESPSFEYFCMKTNTSGSKDVFVFDMTSDTKGAGQYEFCRSNESDEECALGIMSPDGDVKVTVISSSPNRQLELVIPTNFEYIYNDVEIYKQGSDMDSYSETTVLNSDSKQVDTLSERIEALQQIIRGHL